jgi:hypothetical protein
MKWSSSIYANGNQMPVLRCRQPMSPVAGAQRQKGAKAPPTHIERMLADARLRLVETGTRNRLVHTARGGKRTRSLPILNADADTLFEAAARSGKAIWFQATRSGLDLDDDGNGVRQNTPTFGAALLTNLDEEALEKRLLSIYRSVLELVLALAIGEGR